MTDLDRFARVDGEEAARRMVQSLCSTSVDGPSDEYFVDVLIAEFSTIGVSEFVSFITKSTNKQLMKMICQRLGAVMSRCSNSNDTELEWRVIVLISLLASFSTLRLSTDESRSWISFLTKQNRSDNLSLKTALATILASPNLMPDQASFKMDDQIERSLIEFFMHLRSLIQSPEYSSLSNMMILVYVHLITENATELAALLSSVLGRKVQKTLQKQPYVKSLYVSHAIREQDVAEKAANINVTKGLNANTSGYLPVHCIASLLHWRSFSRYSTPIQEWIKSQLKECRTPVHPSMAPLLENFASSCIPNESFQDFNQPIDEQFFEGIFAGDIFDQSRLCLRILSLTYLSAFSFKLDTTPSSKNSLQQQMTKRTSTPYSQKLWKSIPIRYLLIMADQKHSEFQHIRSMLLRYVIISVPHLLPEQAHFDAFNSIHLKNSQIQQPLIRANGLSLAIGEAIQSSERNYRSLSAALNALSISTVEEQFCYYDDILRAMVISLDQRWPRTLLEKLVSVWERFDSIVPRRLHEDTIRIWLSTPYASTVPNLAGRDNDFIIAHTPLILFRADSRIFRSPPHLRSFCRTMSFYLAASRDTNFQRLTRFSAHNGGINDAEEKEKHELLRSFIGTQRLAVVQVFIELCDGDPKENPDLEEIRQLLCAQIHQFFIADTHLPKLVHFNMYPLRLIPVIVKRVPSVHVLINSIGELIIQGNLERRIFTVVLITELLEQYKIPNAFAAVTLISDMLDTLLTSIISDEWILLMLNIIPSLARLVTLSPFHAEHFIFTLQRARELAKSRLAIYTSLKQARESPEWKLLEKLNRTMEALPKLSP